jgi:hypothetical protein
MPAINLLRNTKVFFTTLTKSTISAGAINPSNTWEIQVLSDFQYSQSTEQETITLNEAGATPTRGQRSFNTKMNPVEWSFGTYVRPNAIASVVATGTTGGSSIASNIATVVLDTSSHGLVVGDKVEVSGSTPADYDVVAGTPYGYITSVAGATITYNVASASAAALSVAPTVTKTARTTAPEALLWNALAGAADLYGSNTWSETSTQGTLSFANSNAHQLASFGLIFKTDNTIYLVDKCAVNQADISFGIDQIASIAWSGQGTELVRLTGAGYTTALASILSANTWDTTANFITNKLSTVSLTGYNIYNGVSTPATQAYLLALTGGQVTISNNIQYLTPEVLGTVNKPIGYYTGTRAISGNMTAYLKVKAGADVDKYATELLEELIAHSSQSSDNVFTLTMSLGGAGSTFPKVDFVMPATMLQIPNVDVQNVVSTTINFTAQASTGSGASTAYDINGVNELEVRYITA